MFYQILKGVYTSNLFETCFMVANEDSVVRSTALPKHLFMECIVVGK